MTKPYEIEIAPEVFHDLCHIAGGDPRVPRVEREEVWECHEDQEWVLEDLIQELADVWGEIAPEYQGTAKVEFERGNTNMLGSICVVYERPETIEEVTARIELSKKNLHAHRMYEHMKVRAMQEQLASIGIEVDEEKARAVWRKLKLVDRATPPRAARDAV